MSNWLLSYFILKQDHAYVSVLPKPDYVLVSLALPSLVACMKLPLGPTPFIY